ncbi:uncharacterized protein K444DRAFT_337599 [Hyaloscypha bicolor E]|uniref:Uncharacterized protein n=1 Tax=Hyaloscypha bicolor E TaxID=1095630 RepID=A0A2J6TGR5_9HELO|nr:uncharacterized protein K444DRAFT_337599 [Hyaloscypha bicolor E]PMD62226.1 hypothetical protein K444DRAFT_337599 [Hyaloscypha bicolor E]
MLGCQTKVQHGSLIEIPLQTVFVMLVVFNATALTAHKLTHPVLLKQCSGTLFVKVESDWREGGHEYELLTPYRSCRIIRYEIILYIQDTCEVF